MSEETRKMSAFEAFKANQLTYAEAEEKAKLEAGAPRVQRFRIGEDGEYSIRVLPLAPSFDNDGNILPMARKGYEYPLHQLFVTIKAPAKKGKERKVTVPIIRTTDKEVGYSVDLIDTYLRIAQELYPDDEELIKLITGSSFNGGLRWGYQHAMFLLDVSNEKERAKGPQLWQCSHSQYKDIDAAKMRLWRELREDDDKAQCPISSFTDAYPVKIIRSNNGGKTEYKVEIGRKTLDIKEEEADKLLDLPRIPETIYRYTRYQYEATIEFLKQYDEQHEMEVCSQEDFMEAVKQLGGELPKDDNSHFDLNGAASKDGAKEDVTIDSLWSEYDAIVDQDLGEKSDEYQDLREKIRQFIVDKELDVRISRSKNNQQLLDEIEDAWESKKKEAKSGKPAEKPAEQERAASKPEPEEDDDDGSEPEKEAEPEEGEPEEERPVRRRRARPGSEEAEEKPAAEESKKEEREPEEEEESPRRRTHARRLR